MFNHHPTYSPDLVPSDFHLFLHLKKFLSGQRQRFQDDREAEMSVTVVPISSGRLQRHKMQKLVSRYDKYLNFEVNTLKNISTLVVSVLINLSIKLGLFL